MFLWLEGNERALWYVCCCSLVITDRSCYCCLDLKNIARRLWSHYSGSVSRGRSHTDTHNSGHLQRDTRVYHWATTLATTTTTLRTTTETTLTVTTKTDYFCINRTKSNTSDVWYMANFRLVLGRLVKPLFINRDVILLTLWINVEVICTFLNVNCTGRFLCKASRCCSHHISVVFSFVAVSSLSTSNLAHVKLALFASNRMFSFALLLVLSWRGIWR